jgi:ribosomal protein L37AE/L43A
MSEPLTLIRTGEHLWTCEGCGISFGKDFIDLDPKRVYEMHKVEHEKILIKGEQSE